MLLIKWSKLKLANTHTSMQDSYNKNVAILTFAINITLYTSLNQQKGPYVTKLSYNKDKALLWLFWEILPAFREGLVIDLFITICIPITQECIAVILTKVSLVVLNNKIFDVVIYFHYITITLYLSFEKGFIWIKLEFHTPKNAKSSSNLGFQNYLYYVA